MLLDCFFFLLFCLEAIRDFDLKERVVSAKNLDE